MDCGIYNNVVYLQLKSLKLSVFEEQDPFMYTLVILRLQNISLQGPHSAFLDCPDN